MRRPHWSALAGALILGLGALLTLGPVVVAVLMLRCCDDSTGPTWEAWALLLVLLAGVVGLAAALGGWAGRRVHRVMSRLRR